MGKSLKLLVIGGSGFVSGTLARRAVAEGHEVWIVTRGQAPLPDGVHAIACDRKDQVGFAAAIHSTGMEWDLAVDCIGYQPEDAQQDIQVLGPRTRHIVFISTDFVYDPLRRRFPQPEETDYYYGEGYGANKRQCELEFINHSSRLNWTILRPCHIYGPGSQLGCLPLHGRDPQLIQKLRDGQPLQLVGGGYFLQQPIFAPDLAATILSCAGNTQAYGQIYNTAGPDIVESRTYYQIVADALGVEIHIEEVAVDAYRREHPEMNPFLCHRIYDLLRLHAASLAVPATPLADGLRRQVESLKGTE
jgi:nucleoside-diphosphate-sugar epimerase